MVQIVEVDGDMVPKWSVLYEEAAVGFRTGDLILQHGLSGTSQAIEVMENCYWSHVGMIVKPSDIGLSLEGDPWCYWESNNLDTLPDVMLGKMKWGPQIVNLQERLYTNAKQDIDVGFLLRQLHVDADAQAFQALRQLIDEIHECTFPDDDTARTEWLAGRLANQPGTGKSYFCSQMIAATYQAMGLMTEEWVSNAYSPRDFTSAGTIPLLRRAMLGESILLEAPKSLDA